MGPFAKITAKLLRSVLTCIYLVLSVDFNTLLKIFFNEKYGTTLLTTRRENFMFKVRNFYFINIFWQIT